MEHIKRYLKISEIIKEKSVFLFGPRLTGKSTLLRYQLGNAEIYNLLDSNVYRQLSSDPSLIRKHYQANPKETIVIDEVQRIPELLNEVHLMIEEYGTKFVLTGSSARALKKKSVNLLAGRARSKTLHPFSYKELGDKFNLTKALNRGLIPSIYNSSNYKEDLADYTGTYLREEIAAEGLSRNIPAFSRFLEVAAKSNGTLLNYSNIASDAEVKRSTVVDYFGILKDTHLAIEVPAWKKTSKRKAIGKTKFYFFDLGVVNFLCKNGKIETGSSLFGQVFEHYLFHELKSYCDYNPIQELHYWRSKSQFEVDFILNEEHAIEVKGKKVVTERDLRGLRALEEESLLKSYHVVALVAKKQQHDSITIWPYKEFLDSLWSGTFR